MPRDAGLDGDRLADALDALLFRVRRTLDRTGEAFPLVADPATGEWETTADGNWCGGHWIGLLWLAHAHASDREARERFAAAARSHTETMRRAMPTDTMFCGMNFHYAGFRGYDRTGDRTLFALGLTGADAMVELFDESARQIPSGPFEIASDDAFSGSNPADERFRTAAVDNVYTALPVLWRAFDETGDPRFRDVAVSHADRHLDWLLRDDGRTWHHLIFDEDGSPLRRQNDLAHADETCWARGQGWHVAGLSRAYAETGARRYLDALELSLDYWTDRAPDDLVPYWDFEDPAIPDAPRDASAAALAAYGLAGLDGPHEAAADLRALGADILESLLESYLVTDADPARRGMVRHGCYDKPGGYATDNELIWTDYYVAHAVDRHRRRRDAAD